MLRRVALVRTDISEERRASFIRVTRIGELRATLAIVVTSSLILATLMTEALSSSETSVLTRPTRHNIPEDAILNSPLLLWAFGIPRKNSRLTPQFQLRSTPFCISNCKLSFQRKMDKVNERNKLVCMRTNEQNQLRWKERVRKCYVTLWRTPFRSRSCSQASIYLRGRGTHVSPTRISLRSLCW
jgi:hypothetical protein